MTYMLVSLTKLSLLLTGDHSPDPYLVTPDCVITLIVLLSIHAVSLVASVRGRAPETQVSADLCGHSVQRWLGTININAYVVMTPRSGVSADGDKVDGVGDEVGVCQ
ncbi:uncharacterized protein UDID_17416 [Ustilago sp. UG-2017a]|nr:uncharacterized protein UDID_17416 [Ustilago sp. UG-2017a]